MVLFDGQSHNVNPATPFPALAMAGRDEAWANVAVSGQSWTALAATHAVRSQPVASFSWPVVVLTGGTSDLGSEGDTAAQAMADLEAYVDLYEARGVTRFVVATVPPAANVTGSEETARVTLNGLIRGRAGWTILDLAVAPQLVDTADTTYYQGDQIHFTAAGAQVAADLLTPILDALA